ncbi:hypothetical protein MBLNU13_g10195t1 [Cladosporium sp. NU13]
MTDFTLSTLDRGAPRTYIRYALTFACNADQSAAAIEKLQKATKRIVSEIPMLAGVVTTCDQANPTIAVTLQQVNDFRATIARPQIDSQNYAFIRRHGFAPKYMSSVGYTPLADDLIGNTNACCAIQANLIDGGLVLVIYLHHAVADIEGVATILRLISEGLPARELSEESLELEATTVSQARARLSSGTGISGFLASARDVAQRQRLSAHQAGSQSDRSTPVSEGVSLGADADANRAGILRFRLNIINQTTEMINKRRLLRDPETTDKATPRDVLIAILWRASVRACWANGTQITSHSSISFPVDIRPHQVPPLEPHWMGNAEATAVAVDDIVMLRGGYDLSYIEHTVNIVHESAKLVSSDVRTRSRIEMINQSTSVPAPTETQLVIHDWTPVPRIVEQEMDLGLGLGRPDAIRRIGRSFGVNEMVLLPEDHHTHAWDVQVEIRGGCMTCITGDEGLGRFLWSVAL